MCKSYVIEKGRGDVLGVFARGFSGEKFWGLPQDSLVSAPSPVASSAREGCSRVRCALHCPAFPALRTELQVLIAPGEIYKLHPLPTPGQKPHPCPSQWVSCNWHQGPNKLFFPVGSGLCPAHGRPEPPVLSPNNPTHPSISTVSSSRDTFARLGVYSPF